jgi:hypothetical protein
MRFTIRDMIWLTVVVAFATAWYVERRSKPERIEELLQERYDLMNAAADRGFIFVELDNGYELRGDGEPPTPQDSN